MSPRAPTRDHPIRGLRGTALAGIGLAALLIGIGCDSATPAPEKPVSAPAPVARAEAPPQTPELALPGRGIATLSLDGDRITLLANAVPAAELLDKLKGYLRFEIEVGQGIVLPRAVTLRLADVGVDDALKEILAGLPYAVFYAVDPDDQSRVLSRLVVGELDPGAVALSAAQPRPGPDRPPPEEHAHRGPRPTPEEQREKYAQNQELWYDDLFDPDPTTRAYAADAIYLDDQTFPILSDMLVNDPDPEVRVAAASTLGDELDNPSAADALLPGLHDSNAEVVIETLDALEDVGSAANISDIQPLLVHPNPDVRAAALDAIEWLED